MASAALPGAPLDFTRFDRRDVLLGGTFLTLAAAGLALKPYRDTPPLAAGALDAAIPAQIGPYRSAATTDLVVPQKDDLSARLYDQVLTRIYFAPGQLPLGLLIAYGSAQDAGLQLHRPDACYAAQGFVISQQHHVTMPIDGRSTFPTVLTASRFDRTEQLFYWTRIGPTYPPEARDEQRVILAENVRGRMPDGVLTRLSLITGDAALAQAEAGAFARMLIASLGAQGRRLLLGRRADPAV